MGTWLSGRHAGAGFKNGCKLASGGVSMRRFLDGSSGTARSCLSEAQSTQDGAVRPFQEVTRPKIELDNIFANVEFNAAPRSDRC